MTCKLCGFDHGEKKCVLIKAYDYYPDGTVKRVEFLTPADINQQQPALLSLPTRTTLQ